MQETLIENFKVDKAAILADLKALQVQNWDVDSYTTKFNVIASKQAM